LIKAGSSRIPRKRKRSKPVSLRSPQGALELEQKNHQERPDWESFSGLTGEQKTPSSSVSHTTGSYKSVRPTQSLLALEDTDDQGEIAAPGTETTEESQPQAASVNSGVLDTIKRITGVFDSVEQVPDLHEQMDTSLDTFQLDLLETEEKWSLGTLSEEILHEELETPFSRRNKRRTRRLAKSTAGRITAPFRRATHSRRGISLIVLVGLLGLFAASYRGLTGMANSQIEEANILLSEAHGEALLQAETLFLDNIERSPVLTGERLAFIRALLVLDYRQAPEELTTDLSSPESIYGAVTTVLLQLQEERVDDAVQQAERLLEEYSQAPLAHWARGRVAVEQRDWSAATENYNRAMELDNRAALPILGAIDIALRSGYDDQAESLLLMLSEISPSHPMGPIGRTVLAFGIDPTQSRAANLDINLPDPEEQLLSNRTQELANYVKARQELAAGNMESLSRTLRQLRGYHETAFGVRARLLEAYIAAGHYQLELVINSLDIAIDAVPDNCPAEKVVSELTAVLFTDLSRPDLALERADKLQFDPLQMVLFYIETGREGDALTLLGPLMETNDKREASLRILVDYHLRRGVAERARLRGSALSERTNQLFAAARLSLFNANFEDAISFANEALSMSPDDRESLFILARAMAHAGHPERALERLDEASERAVLQGQFDRTRLEVLLISQRAPRETIAQFVSVLDTLSPTSITTISSLALAFETLGDTERATLLAQQVLSQEPHNPRMHALIDRMTEQIGMRSQTQENGQHLALSTQ
jgi:tetratricopeptide (TPR) repeat protein